MKVVLSLLVSLLVISSTSAQRAIVGAKTSAFAFGKCPNVCDTFNNGTRSFLECANLDYLGCRFLPCPKEDFFSCRLPAELDEGKTVPGSGESTEIAIGSVPVYTLSSFYIRIKTIADPVDVYLLTDNTGGLARAIGTLKSEFSKVISAVRNDPTVVAPRFGVGFFQDELTPGTDFGFENIQSLTSDEKLIESAILKYRAVGGGDVNEANLVGLYKVATDPTIGWRPASRKIIVYIGDSPGHEPTCGNFGGATKLTRTEVVTALNRKKISVIGMSVDSRRADKAPRSSSTCSGPTVQAAPDQYRFITQGSEGIFRQSTAESLIEDIINSIKRQPSILFADSSDCGDRLTSVLEPSFPILLRPGDSRVVKQTVTATKKYCPTDGSGAEFRCNLRYLQDGLLLAAQEIVICPKFRGF